MRPYVKDYLGVTIVAVAAVLLLVHERSEHRRVHIEAATRAVSDIGSTDPDTAAGVTVFTDFTLADRDGRRVADHQSIVVRDRRIEWIGPSDDVRIPDGARVFEGDGTQFVLPADPTARLDRPTLEAGDPADVLVVADDPVRAPEVLDRPLCLMRQGVVVSLSPSLAAGG